MRNGYHCLIKYLVSIVISRPWWFGVTSSPGDPRFAGLNTAHIDTFFHDVKVLSTCPPRGPVGSDSEDFQVSFKGI